MSVIQAERYPLAGDYEDVLQEKTSWWDIHKLSHEPLGLRWYIALLASNWPLASQMVFASILVQLFALGMPVFYIVIFDRVFGRQNLATLDIIGVGILVMLAFDLIVKMLRTYLMSHQLEWLDKITSGYYLDQLFQSDLSKVEDGNKPPLSEHLTALLRMNLAVSQTVLLCAMDTVFSLLVVVLLVFMHPLLAAISLLPLIPIAIYSLWHTPKARRRAELYHKEQRNCQYQLAEVLRSGETLDALDAADYKQRQVQNNIHKFIYESFGTHLDQVGAGNVQGFFINLGSILTLYVGAKVVLQGEVSFGVYIAINMMSRIVLGSVQKLMGAFLQYQESMGATRPLREFLDETAVKARGAKLNKNPVVLPSVKGHIQFHQVSFRYSEESAPVLDDLSLDIQPGERVVLTGKSGAGKTTLLNLVQRMHRPSNGYITLDGYNLNDLDIHNLRSHVGGALQKPAVFAGTVEDNIHLANPNATTQQIVEAAKMAQLDDILFESESGLGAKINHFGVNMSGGQVARIAVARIFLRNPSVILLDEALTAVPPVTKVAILNAIHKNFKEATCIFVSNFIPLHQNVNRILVLDQGKIVEQGTFRELVEKQGFYHQLYDPSGGRS